ncbi:MAG TPA: 50S ribosomal protein L30 [Firmicutes bacterium]|jgi:large subunit ribosomal protein L30|nr:50S ribosomal protein L30 [Bacillota bacterium]
MPRKKAESKLKMITVIWKHSAIGRPKVQKDTIGAIGFKWLNQSLVKADTPALRGMIKKVEHLVEVKEEA